MYVLCWWLDISTCAYICRFFTMKNCKILIVLAISTFVYMQGHRVCSVYATQVKWRYSMFTVIWIFQTLCARAILSSIFIFYDVKLVLKGTNSLIFFIWHKTFVHLDSVPQIGYEIICIKVEESFIYIKVNWNTKESIYCAVKNWLALWVK